uniref:hypothetical protein n=1 Tax=Roseivirga sp. TaxID=1964215 RepID=UPI004048CE38
MVIKIFLKNYFNYLKNKINNYKLCKIYNLNDYSFKEPFDKLFILGSGLTINELNDDQLKHINQFNSVGVNFFMIHPFRPTHYFIEISRSETDREMYFHNLELREDYDRIAKFYCHRKEDNGLFKKIMNTFDRNELYTYSMLKMGNYGKAFNYENLLSRYYNSKLYVNFFKPNVKFKSALNNVSSIERMCQFGLQGGANEIILCGVDFRGTECFFDSENFKPHLDFKIPYGRYKGKENHTTNNKLEVSFTVEEFLKSLTGLVKTKFYVSSKNSKLSEFIPVYNFGVREEQ